MMLGQNLTRALIVLIIANLAFMVGLEIQRRTIWNEEVQYLKAMEAYTISNVKSEADYDDIRKRLGNIEERITAVQVATQDNAAAVAQIKDIGERVSRIDSMIAERLPAASTPQGNLPK